MAIFKGRVRVRYGYSRWGWTRGGGKTWHGGSDEEGLDSTAILMPGYGGRRISGRVITARRVDKATGSATWEWGWYVCVQLDAGQTPDAVNFLYFCHNAKNLVAVGQRVKTGDALAEMGNTGNAALASPPFAHCHFEVRAAATGKGLDPTAYTGHPNAVGTYFEKPEGETEMRVSALSSGSIVMEIGPASAGDREAVRKLAAGLGLACSENAAGLMFVGPASAGDQVTVLTKAAALGLPYGIYEPPGEGADGAQAARIAELEKLLADAEERAQAAVQRAEEAEKLAAAEKQRAGALEQTLESLRQAAGTLRAALGGAG